MTAAIESKIPNLIKCLLSQDQETGLWISHCLDFDIITSGSTESESWDAMKKVLRAHIESCIKDGFEAGLSRQAPVEYWREFADLVFSCNVRSEPIDLHLKNRQAGNFWMKGVEVESLSTRIRALA
jgi:hypothetical protein